MVEFNKAYIIYKQFGEALKWIGDLPAEISINHQKNDLTIDLFLTFSGIRSGGPAIYYTMSPA